MRAMALLFAAVLTLNGIVGCSKPTVPPPPPEDSGANKNVEKGRLPPAEK